MKNPAQYCTIVAITVIAILGCVTPRSVPPQPATMEPDDLKERIEAAVNDRSNWVLPNEPESRKVTPQP